MAEKSALWSTFESHCQQNPFLMREMALWHKSQQEMDKEFAFLNPDVTPLDPPVPIESHPQELHESDKCPMKIEESISSEDETEGRMTMHGTCILSHFLIYRHRPKFAKLKQCRSGSLLQAHGGSFLHAAQQQKYLLLLLAGPKNQTDRKKRLR